VADAARFDGRVLLATGAGSGIARAVARAFAHGGGRVAVLDVDEGRAESVASELTGAVAVGADVADEQAVGRAVATVVRELGPIDCVLNAAGHVDYGPLEDWTWDRWRRMLDVHAGGTFLVCRAVLPQLRERGSGSIVNVSSIAALAAQPHNAVYGAAKGAILAFSRQLALEAAPHIRVNVIAPGRTRTGMTEPFYAERGGGDYERGKALSAQHNLQNRVAEPEEIAAAACFLFSDAASFITGQTIVVDAGETA
jgi:NAD(P)-dependent dehydrogenase (short-subunit alcohol dehydrogenase family)